MVCAVFALSWASPKILRFGKTKTSFAFALTLYVSLLLDKFNKKGEK